MKEDSKQIIDNWLSKINSQEIVIVVGAGFTRNALMGKLNTSGSSKIPLWNDLILSIQKKMNLLSFDSLLSFDIYREFYGMHNYQKLLLDSMPNNDLKPGEAHECLRKMPKVKAIITTNNIDTLLDDTFDRVHKIVKDTDVIGLSENDTNIIYLHGHRDFPESWVFSRADYEDINDKYLLKTSFCRNLLATYPSLFLGFGYSDHDLHSIMRYVNHTVNAYKPAMLSLAISKQNTFLADYWKQLGLFIVDIYEDTGKKTVSQCLVEAMKYINKKRIEALIKDGKIPLGYRNEKSFMDILMEQKFECKKRNGTVVFCDYHESRKTAEIHRIPDKAGITSISPYTAFIQPGGATEKVILKMCNGYNPAGSWGLMPTHREWLKKGIRRYKTRKNDIRIMIAGIAGLPHFVDTLSLLLECIDKKKQIEVTVADICAGPLSAIDNFIKHKDMPSVLNNIELYDYVYDEISQDNIKISLVHCDILNQNKLTNDFFDIILSHHLVTTCNIDNILVVERYAEIISNLLTKRGLLISAQNIVADELKILRFQKIMEGNNLIPIDSKSVFDIYDYDSSISLQENTGLFVMKETLLAIHGKG